LYLSTLLLSQTCEEIGEAPEEIGEALNTVTEIKWLTEAY
jgi:hypothetical protein